MRGEREMEKKGETPQRKAEGKRGERTAVYRDREGETSVCVHHK